MIAIVGPGLSGVYIGEIAVSWALYARITRAEMLVLREQQFIVAAQALGYSTPRILFKHALPHLIRPNLVFSMADIVLNILVLASLSFLGVGVQPPLPELGAIVADGQQYLLSSWWITTLPGQLSSVGITSPTPFPLRVGANARTWLGPPSRR